MVSFEYKGFLGSYEIKKIQSNLFAADGDIRKKNDSFGYARKFYTENLNELDAQKDIISLMEDYINYELQQIKE
ncbi:MULTISPECIES: hypothetical protein [Legionella]|uniref:Uncharacterized protein n=1 Tax=Legionella drozanskii LLAP-1 TaxID=1212489 RepID=A0A0W0TE41_9GAMM|nr:MULTISPECIES: hypothetical protein [Legionella]KTC93864.1 hypothetical protein Ldro_0214 [Legionella drozanskii LLAP-1]PJE10286.1 MAG: hypothetical protein CK430_10405 [Legionella sp.]